MTFTYVTIALVSRHKKLTREDLLYEEDYYVLGFAVAAISTTAFGAQQASAKEITVKKGDTLWGISQKK
ncbi:hypothetical protein BsIDN1_36790 [Bacillus safensis]|uniref:LysM domain-containing protein n=1 Tax=Bacillus safensis TaxID=561879 RepID=A0A5S9MAY5_BACIA|nr:hypothetical protein BsIDN1_36790 [Bacillus safensis]